MGATEELQNSQKEKPEPVEVSAGDDAEKSVGASPSSPSSGTPVDSEELEPIVTLKTWIVTIVRASLIISSKSSALRSCLLTMLADPVLGIWSLFLADSRRVGHWNPSRS